MHIGTGTIGYPLLRATFISKERAHAPYIPYNFYINSFIRLNFNSSMTMTSTIAYTYRRSQPNFVSQEQSLDLVKTVAKCVCRSDGRLFRVADLKTVKIRWCAVNTLAVSGEYSS